MCSRIDQKVRFLRAEPAPRKLSMLHFSTKKLYLFTRVYKLLISSTNNSNNNNKSKNNSINNSKTNSIINGKTNSINNGNNNEVLFTNSSI